MTKAKSWFIAANADLQEKKRISIYFLDILIKFDKANGTMVEVHEQIRGEQYITKSVLCIFAEIGRKPSEK